MSADAWTARVVGVVKKALHVQMNGLETVLAAMREPQIAIVSGQSPKRVFPLSGDLDS